MVDFVIPDDPSWKNAFEIEAALISSSLSEGAITLHHIGSTAIEGILAKPIIDLLGVVSDFEYLDARSDVMEGLGYEVMGPYGIEGRRYFRKTRPNGQRSHHLHIFEFGSLHIERHLAFRDYLNSHSDIAADYSNLKASLTAGKDPFIAKVEQAAVSWFRQE